MAGLKIKPKHFAISVENLEETIEWYGKILGFELISKDYAPPCASKIALMSCGELELEIFQSDETRPITRERMDPDRDPKEQGMKHVCFGVENLDEALAFFKANNVEIIIGPVESPGHRLCYIRDNTGIPLEFME